MTSGKVRIADLIIETGLSYSGLPGAEKIYSFAKLGASFVRDYIAERNEKKAYEFHHQLLLDSNKSTEDELNNASLDTADYHALLSACLADIEEEKSGLYGHLAKSIAINKVPQDYKRFFITKLKESTWDQLDLLANAHVITKHNIMPPQGNWKLNTDELLKNVNPISARGLDSNFLHQNRFLQDDKISALGKSFIEACFPQDLLTPSAFGYDEWLGANYTMITLAQSGPAYAGSQIIAEHYRKQRIQGHTGLLEGILNREIVMLPATFVIIGYENGKQLAPQQLRNLESYIRRKIALQVIYVNSPSEKLSPITELAPLITIPITDLQTVGITTYEKVGQLLVNRQKKSEAN
ncbi:hypothetical protein [Pseudomonas sp. URMO17WK12:I11]|uniref:hypothetical protein n=1 Tax=Pseudomonas sp. URMO17WK12:I11 TaxID=1283291 RepID=UPI0011A39BBA|nr:hypothetical protein [Pseudomonas sp. URMO17WK12:I11]